MITLGCEVQEMSDNHDSAKGHCCYRAAMVKGNQLSHEYGCYHDVIFWVVARYPVRSGDGVTE